MSVPAGADAAGHPAPLWQVRRRPHRAFVIWTCVLAGLVAIGSARLLAMLMIEPDPLVAIAIGGLLGLALAGSALRGARAEIRADGTLAYGWGGRIDLTVDLRAVSGWRLVRVGMLRGVGARVDPATVSLLNRKGPSYRLMHEHAGILGVALVLEFLTAADLETVRGFQERFAGASAPLLD